jgi:uncharacterized protein YbbC (DUF1343 family)
MKFLLRISFTAGVFVMCSAISLGQEAPATETSELSSELSSELTSDFQHGVLHTSARSVPPLRVKLGNENIRAIYESCSRAPVAVVANATSVIGEGAEGPSTHLIDTLLALGINVKKVFAPEHGFRGDLHNGANFEDGIDAQTRLPILSLHGTHKKPSPESLEDVRMILFDIQDVGARFYTYLSSMFLVMEAAAENGKVVVVLDRPNPHGHQMAGPMLNPKWKSFVGMLPVPVLHGMTLGEMAQMINGEGWLKGGIKCDLIVIPCEGYAHSDQWYPSIAPSPNLPNAEAIALYPSLCPLEPTLASIGRGTPLPFQCMGMPATNFGDFSFTPVVTPGAAPHPKHQDVRCTGRDLRSLGDQWTESPSGFDWRLVWECRQIWKPAVDQEFISSPSFLAKLTGDESLAQALNEEEWPVELTAKWMDGLIDFHAQREAYLLYPLLRK